jgi:phosphoribosylamine-glycine ligase
VLALTVNSNSIPDARELAYNCLENINFEGIYYRKDIGIDLLKYL